MVSFIHVILVSLIGVLSSVHCRFILYDSDDSNAKVDIRSEFEDVKKILANISLKVNTINAQKNGTDKPWEMCPDGWLRFKESCYFFDFNNLNFETATKKCNIWDTHIVRLETQEENHFLKAFMANHFDDTQYWIGMTDIETEGLWKISGTDKAVPFTDWKGNEPQNRYGNEDCAVFWHGYSYGWGDVSCSSKFRAVCENNGSSLNSN